VLMAGEEAFQGGKTGECIFSLPKFKPPRLCYPLHPGFRLLTLFTPGGFEEALRGQGATPASIPWTFPTGQLTYSTTELEENRRDDNSVSMVIRLS